MTKTVLEKANKLFHKIPTPKVITPEMTMEQEFHLKNEEEIERLESFGTNRLIAELDKQQAIIFTLPFL